MLIVQPPMIALLGLQESVRRRRGVDRSPPSPTYFWIALKRKRMIEHRVVNSPLLLGCFLSFAVMLVVMSAIFHVGVVYWYLFLSC